MRILDYLANILWGMMKYLEIMLQRGFSRGKFIRAEDIYAQIVEGPEMISYTQGENVFENV